MAYERTNKWQGQNWIQPIRRLAIYLRDGLQCCYCGKGIEDGIKLNLDHIKPDSKGGNNAASNLITCCSGCNSKRGNKSVKIFLITLATENNLEHAEAKIFLTSKFANINRLRRRKLPLGKAKEMIAERGSCAKAVYSSI